MTTTRPSGTPRRKTTPATQHTAARQTLWQETSPAEQLMTAWQTVRPGTAAARTSRGTVVCGGRCRAKSPTLQVRQLASGPVCYARCTSKPRCMCCPLASSPRSNGIVCD